MNFGEELRDIAYSFCPRGADNKCVGDLRKRSSAGGGVRDKLWSDASAR